MTSTSWPGEASPSSTLPLVARSTRYCRAWWNRGLASRRTIDQDSRPDKQVYRISERGRQVLHDWLSAASEPDTMERGEIELRVFFGASGPPDAARDLIRRHRAQAAGHVERLLDIERGIEDTDEDWYAHQVLLWGLAITRASIDWSDRALQAIERREQARRGIG